jgi:hypothetical protein
MANSIRESISRGASLAALRALKSGIGAQGSYQFRAATAITLWMRPAGEEIDGADVLSIESSLAEKEFMIPAAQPGLLAQVSQKALTSNVVTLTTRRAHGFVVGQLVRVRLRTADSVFDGLQAVVSAPSATTFTFAKTNANVASASALGVVEAVVQPGDSITFEAAEYEVLTIKMDSLRSSYTLRTQLVQPMRLGAT